ncbi:transposase [Rhodovarius sp.]|uniref:helix-turn-helix domain-containing protein n=1 Tax=Rhodovarius sp. TaxID=2972673 RepID=UPI0034A298DD
MARAIALRSDFTGTELRALARQSKNASQARRLLALAVIYDGGARSEAAKLGDVTLQIVRDWVLRFNAEGPRGLIDRKPPGQPRLLTAEHRQALMAIIESGPRVSVSVVRLKEVLVKLVSLTVVEADLPATAMVRVSAPSVVASAASVT